MSLDSFMGLPEKQSVVERQSQHVLSLNFGSVGVFKLTHS